MRKTDGTEDYEPLKRQQRIPPAVPVEAGDFRRPDFSLAANPAQRASSRSVVPELPQSVPRVASPSRGHTLSYVGLLIFTLVVYFRPQESFAALATVPLALIIALATLLAFIPTQLMLEGSLTTRPREVHLLLLLCVTALLSVPLAVSPGDAIHTFWEPFLKAVIIFIIIVNVVRTERRLKGMFLLAFAVTSVLCLAALNEYRLGNLTVEGYRVGGSIAGGMFENANDLGIHLVTMLPLALMLGFATRNYLGKIVYWLVALVTLATMVVTFSRGAFIGLIAAAVVVSWKLARRRRVVVIISVVVAVLIFVAAVPPSYWTRLMSIFDPTLDQFGSSTARSEVLAQSFLVALRHPLTGIGIGNFELVSAHGIATHNAYTQVAAEMGMAALLLYSMFVTAPLNRLRQIERETMATKADARFYFISVGLQGSLIGYMFSSFFVSVAYYWFIYYLVGYAVCFRRIYAARTSETPVMAAAPVLSRKPSAVLSLDANPAGRF